MIKSQAIKAGPHIFVSGQIPADGQGNLVEGSIADKTRASCEGLKAILEEAGSSIGKCVKVRQPSEPRSLACPFLLLIGLGHRLFDVHVELCRDEQRV